MEKKIIFKPIKPEDLLKNPKLIKVNSLAFNKLNELQQIMKRSGYPIKKIDLTSKIINNTEVKRSGKKKYVIYPPLFRI